jgi:hypothetical protein
MDIVLFIIYNQKGILRRQDKKAARVIETPAKLTKRTILQAVKEGNFPRQGERKISKK